MPTYEFRCPDGTIIERSFKISDAPQEIPAPDGSGMAVRVISGGAGLHFKGSGFYITDYGKDGKKDQRTKAEAAKAEAGKSDAAKPDAGKAAAPSEGGATATTGSERAGAKGTASAADRPSEKQSERRSERQSEKQSERPSEKPAAKSVESAPSKPATGGSSSGAA